MKGMVFKFFEQHVAARLGEEALDDLLNHPGLSTGGAYTSVGNYPTSDLTCMVTTLSERTGLPVKDLLNTFGHDLFRNLAEGHSAIMAKFDDCLDMLAGIESVIHRDVRKLYNDAELPRFEVMTHERGQRIVLVYSSSRPFADLAHGLIQGALAYYGVSERAAVTRKDLSPDGTNAQFDIALLRSDAD